jgi:hypothetical protein
MKFVIIAILSSVVSIVYHIDGPKEEVISKKINN